jgi:hypothetical protein
MIRNLPHYLKEKEGRYFIFIMKYFFILKLYFLANIIYKKLIYLFNLMTILNFKGSQKIKKKKGSEFALFMGLFRN